MSYDFEERIANSMEKLAGAKHTNRDTRDRIAKAIELLKKRKSISLTRLTEYLYESVFNSLPEQREVNVIPAWGCSSFVRDGKLYRNLDWQYDKTAEFKIITKDFRGMSFINGITDTDLDYELICQLPYNINDGVNNSGIMVSSHVLFNDWEYSGAGNRDKELTALPFYILSNLHAMADISNVLASYLANIKVNDGLIALGYVMQFMVTDGETTYAILPPESKTGSYELVNITANPKLSNFRWVSRSTVNRTDADIQLHPTGIERWNEIDENTVLPDLRFTKAYENPTRLSEFIGLRETTKNSTDAELTAIYNIAHSMYLDRERDGSLWQTVHSVIYADKDFESLFVQEDYSSDYS